MAALASKVASAKALQKAHSSAWHIESKLLLLADIDTLIQCTDTNLVTKQQRLQALQSDIALLQERDTRDDLEKMLTPVFAELSEKALELHAQVKWLQLGFGEAILSSHADCVLFLVRTGLAFNIAMYKDATANGPLIHDIRFDSGQPMIRMEGNYLPWSHIKDKLDINKRTGQVLLRDNPEVTYTYVSPDGLVRNSRTPYSLYPVEQLSPEELNRLQAHAQSFAKDPSKTCTLQVVTTNDFVVQPSWLTNGLNDIMPNHTSIRLVDATGKVWSFGLEMTREFDDYIKENPTACLAKGYAKAGTPDYRDTRSFDEKIVTHIPIEQKQLEAILQFANSLNKREGSCFCLTEQNCNTFGVMALGLAGIDVDTRTTLHEMAGRALPKLSEIPIVGGPLSWLTSKIQNAVAPIFSFFNTHTPKPIKKAASFVAVAMLYVPGKLGTFLANSLFMSLGATKSAQNAPTTTSWTTLFDDTKSHIHHPYKLVDWQKQQKSTIHYTASPVPRMHLLPK